jgi:GH24 family phage-related lysozyme (muramidase)
MATSDERLKAILAELERFEGRTAFLYNDSANPPNRTIGVGCLVKDVAAARALPFRNVTAGRPATVDEITAEFARVAAMPGSLPASKYRAQGGAAVLELGEEEVTALGVAKLRDKFLPGLRGLCPGFDEFPQSAQSVLIDMAWNLGIGGPATASHRANGLHGFPTMIAACNKGDWATAAKHSHVSTSREARNAWRAAQLLAAAAVTAERATA